MLNNRLLAWVGLLIVFCLLLLPNLLFLVYGDQGLTVSRWGDVVGIACLAWLFFLVVFFRIAWFLLFVLPVLWIVPLEVIHIILYGRTSDIHIFGILSDTTFDEGFQYIKRYWLFASIYTVAITLLVVFLSLSVFVSRIRLPRVLIISVLISVVFLVSAVSVEHYLISRQEALLGAQQDSLLFDTQKSALKLRVSDTFPIGTLIKFFDYRKQIEQMEQLQKALNTFQFGVIQSATSRPEVYVLIIGETARSKNLSLNGYERNTNPLLSKRKNLVSFSNVVTGWAWTRMSVPVILTRKDSRDNNIFFPEKSIISLFEEAGFSTYWLSTQSPYGFHDSPISLHAREAEYMKFLNPVDYKSPGLYDDVMLPYLKNIVTNQKESSKFIVLHMLGSHFNYGDRYPEEFDIFHPSIKEGNIALQDRNKKQEMLNSYDNSLIFADYFIDKVIDIVDENSEISAVFYVSDHGEVIFDGDCEKSGHGHLTEYDHLTASLLWVSDSYRSEYQHRFSYANEKRDSPLSTENIFHSLVGLAGLAYPGQDDTRNIFSSGWQRHPRYIKNGIDFDQSIRGGECKEIIRK